MTTITAPTAFSFARGPDDSVTVRTTMIDDEPWFVGADVLTILYGDASANSRRYATLNENERTMLTRSQLGLAPGRAMISVAESGLYKLIMRSDKPEALVFQHWIASEVLPSIRKTGSYALVDHGQVYKRIDQDRRSYLALTELGFAPSEQLSHFSTGRPARAQSPTFVN